MIVLAVIALVLAGDNRVALPLSIFLLLLRLLGAAVAALIQVVVAVDAALFVNLAALVCHRVGGGKALVDRATLVAGVLFIGHVVLGEQDVGHRHGEEVEGVALDHADDGAALHQVRLAADLD